jgi:hypothetical protein
VKTGIEERLSCPLLQPVGDDPFRSKRADTKTGVDSGLRLESRLPLGHGGTVAWVRAGPGVENHRTGPLCRWRLRSLIYGVNRARSF